MGDLKRILVRNGKRVEPDGLTPYDEDEFPYTKDEDVPPCMFCSLFGGPLAIPPCGECNGLSSVKLDHPTRNYYTERLFE